MIGRLLRFVREASRLGLDPLGLGGLLEAMPNFIGVAVDERLVYVNGASQRLLGVASQDELMGRLVYDFVHPEDRARAHTAMQEARRAGGPVPFLEVRLVRGDGTVLDVEVWLAPIRMRGEDAVLIHGRDHSRRRSAERALQESEALYRRLAENSSDIISEYDAEWRLLYVSPSIERILGYPPNTWVGRRAHESFGEMTHPDDLPGIFALETELDDSPGATTEFIHRARKTDGSWCWLHSRGRRYLADGEMRIVVVSRDVTEERRVLDALRESERRFQTLAQAVPVGIFRIDNRGRHVYLNERWSELTGVPIAEALANPGVRPLHPEDDGRILGSRGARGGAAASAEQRIVPTDPLGAHAGRTELGARSGARSALSPTCRRSAPPSKRWRTASSDFASVRRGHAPGVGGAGKVEWSANAARVGSRRVRTTTTRGHRARHRGPLRRA